MAKEFRLPVNARVRLRKDRSEVYPFAVPGSEGIIRGRKMDPDGFPLVYIEWDKDHWAYQGESDTLTFEDHFELVEEADMSEPEANSSDDLLRQMYKILHARYGDESEETPEDETSPPVGHDDESIDKFMEMLSDAFESVSEGEAFVIFNVTREADNLTPYVFHYYRNREAGLLLEMQMAEYTAHAHQETNARLITEAFKRKKNESGR